MERVWKSIKKKQYSLTIFINSFLMLAFFIVSRYMKSLSSLFLWLLYLSLHWPAHFIFCFSLAYSWIWVIVILIFFTLPIAFIIYFSWYFSVLLEETCFISPFVLPILHSINFLSIFFFILILFCKNCNKYSFF